VWEPWGGNSTSNKGGIQLSKAGGKRGPNLAAEKGLTELFGGKKENFEGRPTKKRQKATDLDVKRGGHESEDNTPEEKAGRTARSKRIQKKWWKKGIGGYWGGILLGKFGKLRFPCRGGEQNLKTGEAEVLKGKAGKAIKGN